MSTAAQVRAAWETAILEHATIQAITPRYFLFEVTQNSEAETDRLFFGKELNYIQCIVTRSNEFQALGELQYTYTVDITYTRRFDVDGDNYLAVVDFFDTLFSLVRTELGDSWDSTVDYWRPQEGPAEITQIEFENEPAWRGAYRFTAFKKISA